MLDKQSFNDWRDWEEAQHYERANSYDQYPDRKSRKILRRTPSSKRNGPPITYDDVIDFHLYLKKVIGIKKDTTDVLPINGFSA